MNCNQNSGCPPRRPGMMPEPGPCQGVRPNPNQPCPGGTRPNQPFPGQRPMPEPPCQGARPMQQVQGFRPDYPLQGPGPAIIGPNRIASLENFPVGMGYVPMQNWETPYPMDQGFRRGTIFPSLDYPFVMGRCRR